MPKSKKRRGAKMAKFNKPLNIGQVDIQVMQQVVNQYKGLSQTLSAQLETFQTTVRTDMIRLIAEVPGLCDRLRVSDDGYEIMELEPESA